MGWTPIPKPTTLNWTSVGKPTVKAWSDVARPAESSVSSSTPVGGDPIGLLLALTYTRFVTTSSIVTGWTDVNKPTTPAWNAVAKPTTYNWTSVPKPTP